MADFANVSVSQNKFNYSVNNAVTFRVECDMLMR